MNFYIPADAKNGDTLLTLTDSSTDLSCKIRVGVASSNANLNNGDTLTLLTNANGLNIEYTTYEVLSEKVSLPYDLTVEPNGNSIIVKIGNKNLNDGVNSNNNIIIGVFIVLIGLVVSKFRLQQQ